LKIKNFLVVNFVCIFLAAFLIVGEFNGVFSVFNQREQFSEIYVLAPNGMAEGYDYLLEPNEDLFLVVGVGNHMGSKKQYLVSGKICEQNYVPNSITPSNRSQFFQNQVSLEDEEQNEFPVTFRLLQVDKLDDSVYISIISVNNEIVTVNSTSSWDSEKMGFLFQLFFELWIYDDSISDFTYDNRFVKLWINVSPY